MRVCSLATIGVLITAAMLAAQAPDPALKTAIDDWNAARAKGDTATWAKYVADDVTIINPNGQVQTKAARTAELMKAHGANYTHTDEKIRMLGTDMAVDMYTINLADGQKQRATSVWVRQGGSWKVESVQVTPIK